MDPLLRWAGGKRWLAPKIQQMVDGHKIVAYHEPFAGGAAIFFSLPRASRSHLSDLNPDLMEVYEQVRESPSLVSAALSNFENTSDVYYRTRKNIPSNAVDRAARFIFLNHTSFNGVHRVNSRGEFNVPYGRRQWVRIPDEQALSLASERLRNTHISVQDFQAALEGVGPGDLVFLDPPYSVTDIKGGFVRYTSKVFSFEDQRRLAESVRRIDNLGAMFILTNTSHRAIDELFLPLGRREVVTRRVSVGGAGLTRTSSTEAIYTNISQIQIS